MHYRAFIEDDDTPFRIEYFHNPNRWRDNPLGANNPIMDINNWSQEIKYIGTREGIADEICNLPNNTGGVYMFYIKGLSLPFIENYIVYIGRCRLTDSQNIRKRAREYFSDTRPLIKKMFRLWRDYLYYRFYPDTDNNRIDTNEVQLIRSILPPLNEAIPDRIEIQETIPAFIN